MTRNGARGIVVRAAGLRVATIITIFLVVLRAAPVRADNVDELIKQLEDDSDKIRLSAAVNLTKLGEGKAILAMMKALGNDSDENVRSAAAIGVGKLINDKTKPSIKNLALNSLKKAAGNDASKLVKSQAQKSLAALGVGDGAAPPPPASGGGNGIYVNIGPMSSKTGDATNDPKLRALMVKVASATMAKSTTMSTTWAGGAVPTGAQLTQKGFQGFYVDGTLNTVAVTTSGSSSAVSCKVSMLLASFPDKSVFGFLSGGANVQASASPKDIVMASEDCVSAVVEDLIAKKIVPTIKTKAGIP